MNQAIDETNRRRAKQVAYNKENNITPMSIIKSVDMELARIVEADYVTVPTRKEAPEEMLPSHELPALIAGLRREMAEAAKGLEFERAAELRDRIRELEALRLRTS